MLQSTVEKLNLSTNSTSAKYQAQPPEKFTPMVLMFKNITPVDLVTNEFERLKSKSYHPPRLGMPDETNINQAPSDISTDRKVSDAFCESYALLTVLAEVSQATI
ncbi:hypothetical protein PtA15_18A377 [Puccinia triticina]|uniref:Uncharacterized protein n=1 Tax=Puccinia triticina TaxID=208348 RepID=A0ABY7DAG5_9BASI|nr:uncharacterized protein PtA15_18A377 [Puccinia triticina]WAQ93317.1 hypothetical protein PtA15_18A377 [Puccinia triticina]